MSKKYSKTDILEKVKEALEPVNLYAKSFVNYRGEASDTGERYSEILSEYLLQNLTLLERSIPSITRASSYNIESHDGNATTGLSAEESSHKEEHIALGMYNKSFDFIGEILNYQIPLKNKQTDKVGKIDLLSFDDNNLHILELKKPDNTEDTLLRCVLEVYTYWETVDKNKLNEDYRFQNKSVRKGILIWETCQAYKDFFELPKTKELTQKLDVDVYVLENIDNPQVKSKL